MPSGVYIRTKLLTGERSPNWKGGVYSDLKKWQCEYREKNKDKIKEYDKKWHKEWYKKNKKKIHQYRQKRRLKVLEHYGGKPPKCACCGETILQFLTIDHINGGGRKEFKKVGYGTAFYSYLIKNNFPEGLQVLCYNCNTAKGFYGKCPHKNTRKVGENRDNIEV